VWVQPATAELSNVLRRSSSNGIGPGAVTAGGAKTGASAPSAAGDDDDSDEDDVPLSSIAAKTSPLAKPATSPLADFVVDLPTEEGWGVYEGEETCKAASAALDDRGLRERALKAELNTFVAQVAARREMRSREAERARIERERNEREIAAASAAASAAATAAASAAAAAAASLQLFPQN